MATPLPSTTEVPVTIVIACYNREKWIGETIRSALEQGSEFEIVVVDDGSEDSSWEVIQSFGSNIRAVRQENSGVSAARNSGLEIARGRLVRFLDSDDRMPAGSLRKQLQQAEALMPLDIVVGDAASIDGSGRRIAAHSYGYGDQAPPGRIERATVMRHIMSAWLPLFPAGALRGLGGFNREVRLAEDQELAMRLLRAGYRFVRVPLVVCEVREHGGDRLSRNFGAAGFRRLHFAYSLMWRGFEEDAGVELTTAERAALGQAIWTAARDAVRDGCSAEARDLFALATRIGGRHARTGRFPARLAYGLLPPLAAERFFSAAKTFLGRRA